MGVGKKKILGRQGPRASIGGDKPASLTVDSAARTHAEGKKTQFHPNVSPATRPAATRNPASRSCSSSATARASGASLRAASHPQGWKNTGTRGHVAPSVESHPSVKTRALAHFEDDAAANMTLQLLLLQQAAPRLGPQPTLLCYPPFLCASQGVASALLPFPSDSSSSYTSAAAGLPVSGAALPPSAIFFPVRHAQLHKTSAENEKRCTANQIDATARLAASLPHALYEVLSPPYATYKPPIGQGGGKPEQQQQQGSAAASQGNDASFQQFHAAFAAAAEASLQQMRHCDCCGLAVQPPAAQETENQQSRSYVKANKAAAASSSSSEESTRGRQTVGGSRGEEGGKEGGGEGAATRRDHTRAAHSAALCVIPVLEPSTRCILITPPKRVCLRCLQILHLPQLLGLSVASILSPQTSPLSKATFSEAFSHFARVNGLSVDEEDDSHSLRKFPISRRSTSAGVCLQQAISAAFGIAALRRRMRWRVKAAFGTSLADFFSHVSSSAVRLPGELLEDREKLQSSNGGSDKKDARGSSTVGGSANEARARDRTDMKNKKKRKRSARGGGTDAQMRPVKKK